MNPLLLIYRIRSRPFMVLGLFLFLLYDPLWGHALSAAPATDAPITCTPPGASATVTGSLTCNDKAVTLSGTSPTEGVTFTWSGPGGFESMLSNPVITLPGRYTLVVESLDGCTSTASVDVLQDISLPGATATVSGPVNCINGQVVITAGTALPNATFRWIGPESFSATTQLATVSVAGGYTLNVTNPANGCTSTATVVVNKNTDLPGVAAYASDVLTCTNTSVGLEASSPTTGVNFEWTGPNGFSSTDASPDVLAAGVYTVKAINPANSCSSTASVTVSENTTPPGVATSAAGQLTCTVVAVPLSGSSPTADINYNWTGPGGFTSIVQNPIATSAGKYSLTITRISNGCQSTSEVDVLQDIVRPGATASSSGQLNCLVSEVSLQASTAVSPTTFKWIGPSGYSSAEQNPVVSVSGGYTLTVTNPANGCTSTTVAVVQKNITPPAAVSAVVSGPLNCSTLSVTLTAGSTTTGVTYLWSGPGTITNPTAAVATVSTPGVYTVTITNPANGCTAVATVTVVQSVDVPAAVQIQTPAILTCEVTTTALKASSTTAGVTYQWSGPGVITNPASAEARVSTPGVYTVTVTNPSNGCTVIQTVTVLQDIVIPADVTATVSEVLTCTTTRVTLRGSSSTPNVSYLWTGPGTITNATQEEASVSTPGTYTLTVTNTVNGCKTTQTVVVEQNILPPANVTASASGTLTCTVPGVTLSASSTTTTPLVYSWTGPNGFTSAAQRPFISVPGDYTVVVTNTANGCTATAQATVREDKAAPGVVASVLNPASLNCNTLSVKMTATSTTPGVLYSWTGPENYSSAEQSPSTTKGGVYVVVVTNPVNGCTSSSSVTIEENNTLPADVTAAASGVITCSETSVILLGASSTPGVRYSWTGPNGFTSTAQEPEADVEGIYLLTVTDPVNGCAVTVSTTVEKNAATPEGVGATAPGILTCTTTRLTLTGTSTTPGVVYSWTGAGPIGDPTSPTPTVTVPGLYELTVKNPQNNCIATASVLVGQNITVPAAVTATVSGPITCISGDVMVTGGSTTAGVTYEWSGPNGFHANEKNFPTNVPGVYTVTVKHPLSGCTAEASVTVEENKTLPSAVTAVSSGDITCISSSVRLTATSGTAGVTYAWSGAGVISDPTSASTDVSAAGVYTVVVTHPVSGCTDTETVTVSEVKTVPADVTAVASGDITCSTSTVTLTAASGTNGTTYAWSGPGSIADPTASSVSVSAAGVYRVTVKHPVSGCTTEATVTVREDKVSPGATASPSGPITCVVPAVVTLNGASPTSGVTYSWTGSGAITDPTSATPTVSTAGTYTVTVTNPVNGCVSTAVATVTQNTTAPNAGAITASSGFILTCYSNTTTLSCTSTTSGATFTWTNASGVVLSNTASVVVSAPDTYTFTVTNPANGCTSARPRAVTRNLVPPVVTSLTASSVITCANPEVTLTGTSSGSPVTFDWSGPGPITVLTAGANSATASVTVPGVYTLSLTTPGGCTAAGTVTVGEDRNLPADVNVGITGDMCADSFVTLVASSSTPGVTYQWTGPIESTEQNLMTTIGGEYIVTVTSPGGGCSVVKHIMVRDCEPAPIMSSSEATGVAVYPNPVTNSGTLEFTPDGDGFVQVELYDATHVKVSTLYGKEAVAGKVCTVTFDTQAYASGLYFYRVTVGSAYRKEGRIVIVH